MRGPSVGAKGHGVRALAARQTITLPVTRPAGHSRMPAIRRCWPPSSMTCRPVWSASCQTAGPGPWSGRAEVLAAARAGVIRCSSPGTCPFRSGSWARRNPGSAQMRPRSPAPGGRRSGARGRPGPAVTDVLWQPARITCLGCGSSRPVTRHGGATEHPVPQRSLWCANWQVEARVTYLRRRSDLCLTGILPSDVMFLTGSAGGLSSCRTGEAPKPVPAAALISSPRAWWLLDEMAPRAVARCRRGRAADGRT
jgi:hypothetical protein